MDQVLKRVLCGLCLVVSITANVLGQNRQAAVELALSAQDAWLSNSSKGTAWQQYLETGALRDELAKGTAADKRVLARILGRYQGGAPGTNSTHISRTREALRSWANDLQVPMALRWAGQLRNAADQIDLSKSTDQRHARAELVEAAMRLDLFLQTGDTVNADSWRRYLGWQDLQSQLRAEQPEWDVLDKVGGQFFGGHPGLEFPAFVNVRNALRKFLYLGRIADSAEGAAKEGLGVQMKSLADALEKYNNAPTTKSAANVAMLGHWLDQLGHIPGLLAEVRSFHDLPNVRIKVSEQFLARRFSRHVQDQHNLDEFILGTHVRGTATTTGTVTADIVPNPDRAQIDILFHGLTNTNSVGRQSPVTIYSQSATSLQARKSLFLSFPSLDTSPARATASTNTHISQIVPDAKLGRRLIERVAWKRAGVQKPKTEMIASERAAGRLERQFDAQTEELVERARQLLRDRNQGVVRNRGLMPESIRTASDERTVVVMATQASPAQFAAMQHPPRFNGTNAFSAQIHESAINNTIEKAIAGLTLHDDQIGKLTEELTGEPLDVSQNADSGATQGEEDKTPWSISFDWQQPITVEFDDQTLTIAVRGRRFVSGERTLDRVMEISAQYRMMTSAKGVELVRQGEIAVDFPGSVEDQRPSNTQIFFRSLMRNKFAKLFRPEIQGKGISLPGRWQDLGTLRLNELSTDEGWLSLGWK